MYVMAHPYYYYSRGKKIKMLFQAMIRKYIGQLILL